MWSKKLLSLFSTIDTRGYGPLRTVIDTLTTTRRYRIGRGSGKRTHVFSEIRGSRYKRVKILWRLTFYWTDGFCRKSPLPLFKLQGVINILCEIKVFRTLNFMLGILVFFCQSIERRPSLHPSHDSFGSPKEVVRRPRTGH